ncbi:MAG: BatA domain-containing protein [Psychroflexus halocasei]
MVFKNPDILYALFALLIPILIHLFQFRRYKTVWFSNVHALKDLKKQSRKSRELKKLLILLTRLLALTALILAFAEPEIPAQKEEEENQLAIYLDNSLSMLVEHQNLTLLSRAKQDLLANLPVDKVFTLYSNDEIFRDLKADELEDILLKIRPTEINLSPKNLYLKLKTEADKSNQKISFIYISDFLNIENTEDLKSPTKTISTNYYQPEFNDVQNISIENAQLKTDNTLEVTLSSNLKNSQASLSLANKNQLIGKLDVQFKNETEKKLIFKVNPKDLKNAELHLNQDQLAYDNTFYLHQSQKALKRILSIGEQKSEFIKRIFNDQSKYELNIKDQTKVELIDIQSADLIILNALPEISTSLKANLEQALKNQQNIIIIPNHSKASQQEYLRLNFNGTQIFESHLNKEQKITKIHFEHPLYKDVFTDQIRNFDYPNTKQSYKVASNFQPILSYANRSAFLAHRDHLFVFAADINKENSNFTQSPLIVPSLIQISEYKNKTQDLFYVSGDKNEVKFDVQIPKDQILKLVKEDQEFIPEQRNFGQNITLNLASLKLEAGHYALMNNKDTVAQVSFNTTREESHFNQDNFEVISTRFVENSLEEIFTNYNAQYNAIALWKWMLIFAIICFLAEILLIRFLK